MKDIHTVSVELNHARFGEPARWRWHDVEVEIDVKGIAAEMGRQAMRNKSKKSVEIGGLVVVRITDQKVSGR